MKRPQTGKMTNPMKRNNRERREVRIPLSAAPIAPTQGPIQRSATKAMRLDDYMMDEETYEHLSPDLLADWKDTTLPISKIDDILSYFSNLHEVGQGSYGKVYSATLAKSISGKPIGTKVAVKVQNLKDKKPKQIQNLQNELQVLERARKCPNVNQIYDVLYNRKKKELYFVLEYLEGSDLFDLANVSPGRISEDVIFKISHQLIKGLSCLHEKGIAHRDIKSENVMITEGTDGMKAQWIDFGLSCATDAVSCGKEKIVGTLMTMAPEVMALLVNTDEDWMSSDLWSFGCLLWDLCAKKDFPMQEILIKIISDGRSLTSQGTSDLREAIAVEIETPSFLKLKLEMFPKEDYPRIFKLLQALLVLDPKKRRNDWNEILRSGMW